MVSDARLYDIQLTEATPERYTAQAVARADGPQAGDTVCAQIVLTVVGGVPEHGPRHRTVHEMTDGCGDDAVAEPGPVGPDPGDIWNGDGQCGTTADA